MANSRIIDALQLVSLLFVALALVPAGAHLFELQNKMALPPEDYMTVQAIYRGWALFGIVLFGALASTIAHTVAIRGHRLAMLLSALAVVCLVANLTVFFAFTYPMNVATSNWTVTPPDFEAARRQWEYSHAANAFLILAAFTLLTLSVLSSRQVTTLARSAAE